MDEKFEDSFDESELDDATKKKIKKEAKDFLKKKDLKAKWRKEIEGNDAIKVFFERFAENSIERFIASYLDKKYNAYKFRKYDADRLERKRTKWIDKADHHLEPILQKKLFDLQCLWRAEQVELEGVEICFDFDVWESDIFNCPFLEINEDDIEMYQAFLNSGGLDDEWWSDEWQQYYLFKEDDERIPEWYNYHNMRTGNGSLFLLPNLRGEKEEFYTGLYREDEDRKRPAPTKIIDYKPSLDTYGDEYMEFVNEFEDAEFRTIIENHQESLNRYSHREDFGDVIHKLEEIDEYVPIEAHYDYREALKRAYHKYAFGKIAEHLPQAFEQYLFTKSMNLMPSKGDHIDFYRDLSKTYREKIIKGRILNGEPGDLDF